MICDHAASKSSLRLLGNCRGCASTIAVEIDLARGHIVRGEIAGLDVAIGTVRPPDGDVFADMARLQAESMGAVPKRRDDEPPATRSFINEGEDDA